MTTNDLVDITDEIVAEEDAKYFNEEEAMELYDTCIHIMEEFIKEHPTLVAEEDFDEIFDHDVSELMHAHFDYDIFYTEEAEDEMEEIIAEAKKDFFRTHYVPRSWPTACILEEPDYDYIEGQIALLKSKPQPAQRTKEWYEFRHQLITASNVYKALDTQATKNQLIYEKCQPLEEDINIDANSNLKDVKLISEVKMVNTNSTLHWGQKYEPISVLLYEDRFNTRVGDFGCIQHEKYSFLGASPDGINIDPESSRYGRMLEIKNIVNREIDGIPKKEYWIQMQLQMEVCDLEECDFLETRFYEYPDYNSFKEDTVEDEWETEDGETFVNYFVSKEISKDGISNNKDENKEKGTIIYFHKSDGAPFYAYKPLNIIHPDDVEKWEEKTLEKYQSAPYNYTYIRFIYWRLEELSCVLVQRNREWFHHVIDDIKEVWDTIEKERVSGYEHRAPKQRIKKDVAPEQNTIDKMFKITVVKAPMMCIDTSDIDINPPI